MRRTASLLFAFMLLSAAAAAQSGIIDTVAGGGPNNLPAIDANLSQPTGVAVDGAGNLYIASGAQNRVFKVDTSGQLNVAAGTGLPGFSGDGGPAANTSLNFPFGVAVDTSGNLFIADRSSQRIRRVDAATGIITTVAGNGGSSFSGDGGPAISATLRFPTGVAVDSSGSLFIADTSNQRIRRVDAATGIITTVAGNGVSGFSGDGSPATSASLSNPTAVTVDSSGSLFIADTSNQRIRRVDAATGIITTVAGSAARGFSGDGGPATSASLSPVGVAFDSRGNLFIADGNHRIRRVDATSGIITTVAGNGSFGFSGDGGPATSASLANPLGVAVSADTLFIADQSNHRIRRVDATGVITTVAGNGSFGFSGDGFAATSASVPFPVGVAVDANANLFITDPGNQRIRRVDAVTGIITTVAGNGGFGFSGDGGPATSASLGFPAGVAVNSSGNLFIADGNNRIRRVDAASGMITTVAGNGIRGFSGDGGPATSASLSSPTGIVVDSGGNLFIADRDNQRIRRVDAASGIINTVAGSGLSSFSGDGGPATSASLNIPIGVAADTNGNLFIADLGNNRIRRVDAATGIITTVAGSGLLGFSGDGGPATSAGLSNPFGVVVDANGNLFIADVNDRIRRVDAATSTITTVAGNGSFGFSGDGGPATSARLAHPLGVAVRADTLFMADEFNHRIRRVTLILNQPPVADAGPDQTLIVGEEGRFDGSGSSDPDGTVVDYTWDFGDGIQSGGATATHAYAAAGTFTVTLTVEDDDGATDRDSALVTVITPAQAIQQMAGLVASYNLQQGISNSLDAKLQNAYEALNAAKAGQRADAANKLQAFINAVEAQRAKELTSAQADELIALAQRILAVL